MTAQWHEIIVRWNQEIRRKAVMSYQRKQQQYFKTVWFTN
jgi:hypothetical protein